MSSTIRDDLRGRAKLRLEAPRPQKSSASMCFLKVSSLRHGRKGCELVTESCIYIFSFVLVLSPLLYRLFYGLELNGSTMLFALLPLGANSHHEP